MSGARILRGPTQRDELVDEYGSQGFVADARLRIRLVLAMHPGSALETKTVKARLGQILGRSTRPTLYRVDATDKLLRIVCVVRSWHPLEPATLRRLQAMKDFLSLYGWSLRMVTRATEHEYDGIF